MPITGKKRLFANAVLVLASILVASIIFEVALRLLEPATNVQVLSERRTEQGSYLALRPGVKGLMLGRSVTVNEEAYRGPLRSRRKAPDVIRLLFLGDSHTFSMGADDEHAYPAIVERELNATGLCCEVLNFGVPGQDLRQIMTLLEDRGLDYDPDIVVITFHTGDILESPDDAVPGIGPPGQGASSWLHGFKLAALRQSYLARLIIPYGAAFLRGTFGWTGGVTHSEEEEIASDGKTWQALRAKLLELKGRLDQRGVVLAFALFPSMLPFEHHPASGEYEALAAWLEANGIPTIDLLPFYKGRRAGTLTASLLDKHPNEAGYAIAGEAVANFVGILVKRQRDEKRGADLPVKRDTRTPKTRDQERKHDRNSGIQPGA